MESSTHILYPGPQNDTLQGKKKTVYEEVLLQSLGGPEVNKNIILGEKITNVKD